MTMMSENGDDIGGSGYSLEDLSAYLDRGRTPRIPAIERNAECQAILASMDRMGRLSREIVEEQAAEPLAESWYDDIMREVMREFRAGRDIPLARTADGTELVVTEGALYELIRSVGDGIDGLFVGRVRVDQAEPEAPLDVRVTVSVRFGRPMAAVVEQMRDGIRSAIEQHGDLRVGRVDVTVGDVHIDEGEDR
ncbi:Asp23/Gls24 family envelope stress response protein [Microbacterium testaceum]|nr:Asp23/Gls24 family envelope stress response protein [Microbacterium testaceum]